MLSLGAACVPPKELRQPDRARIDQDESIFQRSGTSSCQENTSNKKVLVGRLRHEADAEHRFPGFVQKLHFPFGILLQLAGNAADNTGANAGHLFPGRIVIGKLGALIGRAADGAVSDAKEIERHGVTRCVKAAPGP